MISTGMARRRSLAAILIVLAACRNPEPARHADPPADSRVAAIGPRANLSGPLSRVLDPEPFTPLGKPGPNDWLASNHEPGQTFLQYLQSSPNRLDAVRHTIYLQPLGKFGAEAPSIELLRKYAAAFFMLEVKMLAPIPVDATVTRRLNPYSGQRQQGRYPKG